MRKLVLWAAVCAALPFLRLWDARAKIWEAVWHAAVFATVWMLVSKLFKAWGWL